MKRTNRFVKKRGVVRCVVSQGVEVEVPVFPGILKHPLESETALLPRVPLMSEPATSVLLGLA